MSCFKLMIAIICFEFQPFHIFHFLFSLTIYRTWHDRGSPIYSPAIRMELIAAQNLWFCSVDWRKCLQHFIPHVAQFPRRPLEAVPKNQFYLGRHTWSSFSKRRLSYQTVPHGRSATCHRLVPLCHQIEAQNKRIPVTSVIYFEMHQGLRH